ncbi:MDIS1-interacting receptor like kinase 2-like [Magnolia sinica]|uniref:MDIS1-interacting receptor like kinase 2-like n=1 Tax=Magnolia sinica TaxID=86752 RepID=UPI0026597FE5|nr:MDIS1-interacting receptor like kinase 2-like [Magnolia sinica]
MTSNLLTGSIPSTLGNLTKITFLSLYECQLSGYLHQEMKNMTNLSKLYLSDNNFSGYLPQLCHGGSLEAFSVVNNHFTGEIPRSLRNCTSLTRVRLNGNRLFANVSEAFGVYPHLTFMDVSNNILFGELSPNWGECRNLTKLQISGNMITGRIPPEIGKLTELRVLGLSSNHLVGEIPKEFGKLTSLLNLNLNDNQLSGPLPNNKAFQKAPAEAFIKNKGLCGKVQGLRPYNASSIRHGDVGKGHRVVILIILTLLVALRNMENVVLERSIGNPFAIWNYDGIVVFKDIVEATEGFDDKYCIGTGGYGKVYKANLPTGQVVAVKKLHPLEGGDQSDQRSFRNEIRTLTEVHHRNIVKIYGFCYHARCSFLVYEYMKKGSLASILSNDKGAAQLDWTLRVKVIKGVANALSYMHHDCTLPIVHRDLSSNNVMLNLKLEASVSDFGTARLLIPDSSNWTMLTGTYGYIAPS